MSRLEIYDETGAPSTTPIADHAQISAVLRGLGVRFERWQADRPMATGAGQEEVLAAYREQVDALNREYGFQSVDVVSLRPDNPAGEQARQKFLQEHVHGDFEVRFFVDGSGVFYLHPDERVFVLVCEAGDLISVPASVRHWFDMGARPNFKCIRFFTIPDGWTAEFTGSGIAASFPDYDALVGVRA